MKESNELFELCKQVYEATGWDGTEKFWHSLISHDMKRWSDYKLQDYKPDSLFGMRIVPLYTSDYLLEKLPYKIGKANSAIWLRLGKTRNSFTVCYMGSDLVCLYDFEADTPLEALLRLTLNLHEEGLL